jgi:hypothetical protein
MIIAHKDDYETFVNLLSTSVSELEADSARRSEYYLSRGGIHLEKDVFRIVRKNSKNTIFEGNIELISGQKFPDIVAYVNTNKAYGIEVKTTKQNKWRTTGSSIFEGTRVDDVKKIFLLFGKLTKPIEFKCRKYEHCLYNVAITHSPRYLIDMNANLEDSIFSKIGIDYDTIRTLDNPFNPIKNYFRKGLKEGEDLWWIDNSDDNVRGMEIKLWSNLTKSRKDELRILSLAYFPGLLGSNPKKYASLATWLVSQFGIVNYALRDTFSAGGKILIEGVKFPQIYRHFVEDLSQIYKNIDIIQEDDLKHYWQVEYINEAPKALWKKLSIAHCKKELSFEQFAIIQNYF